MYEYLLTTLILFFATVFLYVYWVFKKSHQFFDECGIPSYNPHWFFGSVKDVVLMRKNILELYKDLYERLKSNKFIGIYNLNKPQLMIFDPDVIKNILVKDFAHFHDRGFVVVKEIEPLTNHLAILSGEEWRNLRIKLTSTFTSGKMRMMFPLLIKCAQDIKPILAKMSSNDETFEMKDLCSRYTTDVIGSCAFGVDTHSLQDPESEFRKMGRDILNTSSWKMTLRMFFPSLPAKYIKLFGLTMFPQHINEYFIRIVEDMVKYREENNITRGDFLDLLIAMKNHKQMEKLKDQDDADLAKFMAQIGDKFVKNDVEMSIEVMAAQCFVFFIAGFEGGSNLLTFMLYELCLHPDIQNKLREEILTTLETNNGDMTYEMMRKMPYLEMVIAETLRKYPAGPMLLRVCTENYKIPDSEAIIKKGTSIVIPLIGLNYDSKYYEKPDDFYPEHFTKEAIAKRSHFAYLPFGEGPRNCIAERFARMQVIVGLVQLLKDFTFELSPKTKVPLEIVPSGGGLKVNGGVWMKCRPLKA